MIIMLKDMQIYARKLNILPRYSKKVEDCFLQKINYPIPNGDLDHSRFVIYSLIRSAHIDIKIYSGDIEEAIYGDETIKNALDDAVYSGVKVDIILEKKSKKYEYDFCLSNGIIPRLVEGKNEKKFYRRHFMVCDSKAFRLEEVHNEYAFENNQIRARANFNDIEKSSGLNSIFLQLYNFSKSII